ncbi:hypothetical protein L1987_81614 [Smallanthus sonchifolius]|uniref:Uncharacterized protein n=1 Tax=Smallanthus sonchifolius TaxID=185202 RepID=A0ACB8YS22_9ASTR|nr:hypothetical protein L1987_81614 [Smallanthus sonchifolius]
MEIISSSEGLLIVNWSLICWLQSLYLCSVWFQPGAHPYMRESRAVESEKVVSGLDQGCTFEALTTASLS